MSSTPTSQSDQSNKGQMNQSSTIKLPGEIASAVNLWSYPLTAGAAASAVAVGAASHAFGLWLGLATGAAEAAQRLFIPPYEDVPAGKGPLVADRRSPAAKASKAARALIDGAVAPALESVAEVSAKDESPALMPEDFRPPRAIERPARPDDLKAISGIGPKLESVLNGLGVWTYGQIAGLAREERAWLDDYLGFPGRIERDDWVGQAGRLTGTAKG